MKYFQNDVCGKKEFTQEFTDSINNEPDSLKKMCKIIAAAMACVYEKIDPDVVINNTFCGENKKVFIKLFNLGMAAWCK